MTKEDKPVLLVVDDDPGVQKQLKWTFTDYQVVLAGDRHSALEQVRRHTPAVITLDLGLPPDPANASEGLACLEQILALTPHAKVIVITGNDDKAHALSAIELGACDFYLKPVDADVLAIMVSRAFYLADLEAENRRLRQHQGSDTIIGNSPQIQQVVKMVERVAPINVTTLLLGESGTGKEVMARAIHDKSPRADKPFVAINCASIPETLLESELFGYEKGAFTGAHKTRAGRIESAQGGTLFLDEIGDMPLELQAKMLRFLQERVIERLGGRQEIAVDVRVICATHRDLSAMVAQQQFREDLFYRISEITITLPPLRQREGDVLLLARAFLHRYNQEFGRQIKGFTESAAQAILAHPWPGNIRELQNKIKSAVIMCDGRLIDEQLLGLQAAEDDEALALNLKTIRDQAEQRAINQAYALANGNMSQTARLLGITRPTLYSLIEKHQLQLGEGTGT